MAKIILMGDTLELAISHEQLSNLKISTLFDIYDSLWDNKKIVDSDTVTYHCKDDASVLYLANQWLDMLKEHTK